MATLIPSLGIARFDARGELRLAERLKDCLEDNAWVWHNIPVGPFGRHPRFRGLASAARHCGAGGEGLAAGYDRQCKQQAGRADN